MRSTPTSSKTAMCFAEVGGAGLQTAREYYFDHFTYRGEFPYFRSAPDGWKV